jgi:hypothetical protein
VVAVVQQAVQAQHIQVVQVEHKTLMVVQDFLTASLVRLLLVVVAVVVVVLFQALEVQVAVVQVLLEVQAVQEQ